MSPALHSWKTKVHRLPAARAAFEKWLFVHISSVLLGKKSGELLVLTEGECRLSLRRQLVIIRDLAATWDYSYQVLLLDALCARIIFYDRARVQDMLTTAPEWVLRKIGYRTPVAADEFLNEVGRRWKLTGRIPDEVGFALGYPAKDVLGFMGLVASPCTGMCGWRIHGDPLPSLRRSREFKAAREQALAFISM